MNKMFRFAAVLLAGILALSAPALALASSSFIGSLNTVSTIASTVPANGDVNPYGIVVVPSSIDKLVQGDILISNFNNSANLQGTGTTIVEISPGGKVSLFARIKAANLPGNCPGGVGLTTALAVTRRGWVIVGSLPTSDGTSATAMAGCLLVLNSKGKVVETISGGPINGPWDMIWRDNGDSAVLFVTNVLNGTVAASPNVVNGGTVVRIGLTLPEQGSGVPQVGSETVIGSGFPERTDPDALVIGPTGLALNSNNVLFINDTLDNRIASIGNAIKRSTSAGTGDTVSSGGALNGPLGLALAPNGDVLAANGGDGNIVEVTPEGAQVAVKLVDASGAGALFGLVVPPSGDGVYFVDDATNTLDLLH
jgi:hypothetical protein